jgi:hypothetical protein
LGAQDLEASLAAAQTALEAERRRCEAAASTGAELLQRNQLLLEQLAASRGAAAQHAAALVRGVLEFAVSSGLAGSILLGGGGEGAWGQQLA